MSEVKMTKEAYLQNKGYFYSEGDPAHAYRRTICGKTGEITIFREGVYQDGKMKGIRYIGFLQELACTDTYVVYRWYPMKGNKPFKIRLVFFSLQPFSNSFFEPQKK